MTAYPNVAEMLVLFSIHDPDFAVILASILSVIANVEQFLLRIIGYTVGARLEGDGVQKIQVIGSKYAQHSVVPASDEDLIQRTDIGDALGLLEARNALQPLASAQINDFQRSV